MGRENRRYLPFIAVLFTYIFVMNLFGLIPGFVLSTDHFPVNFGVALVVFALYNIWEFVSWGLERISRISEDRSVDLADYFCA